MAKFDPLPATLNRSTDRHQALHRWLRRGYIPLCILLSRSDEGFCFHACATSRTKLFTRLFFGSITYSQDATTDIDAKYVKRRGSTQGCALSGSQNHNLTSTPHICQKPPTLGLILYLEISAEKQL